MIYWIRIGINENLKFNKLLIIGLIKENLVSNVIFLMIFYCKK